MHLFFFNFVLFSIYFSHLLSSRLLKFAIFNNIEMFQNCILNKNHCFITLFPPQIVEYLLLDFADIEYTCVKILLLSWVFSNCFISPLCGRVDWNLCWSDHHSFLGSEVLENTVNCVRSVDGQASFYSDKHQAFSLENTKLCSDQ